MTRTADSIACPHCGRAVALPEPPVPARFKLTPRQRDVYLAYARHVQRHGVAPTLAEAGETIGGLCKTTVCGHVKELVRKGALSADRFKSRSARPAEVSP